MNYIALGKNIRKHRKAAGMTQEELAECCECANSFIGLIERAKSIPSVETVVRIANALNVTVDMLLNESYVRPDLQYLQELESSIRSYPRAKRAQLVKSLHAYMKLIASLTIEEK